MFDLKFKEKNFFLFFLTFLIFTLVYVSFLITERNPIQTIANTNISPTIIIDAGHGGIDGGAVGCNGIVEKDLNLKIALKLKTILTANGYNVIMTRETDIMIDGSKVKDMNARLKIIKNNPNAVFLSIHQNLFSSDSSWGAQVFYSPNNPNSNILASLLQSRFVELLQPNNKRIEKQTDSSLFLFKNTQSPAVLIECGFISNALDAKNLSNEDYQNKVAFVIFASLCDYYSYNLNS